VHQSPAENTVQLNIPRIIELPVLAKDYFPPIPLSLFGYPVVSDDTPYCLSAVDVYPDGEIEDLARFNDWEEDLYEYYVSLAKGAKFPFKRSTIYTKKSRVVGEGGQ